MLANHTSIRHLFSKCLGQYEKLRKKQAFLDNYRKFPMFAVRNLNFFLLLVVFNLFASSIKLLWQYKVYEIYAYFAPETVVVKIKSLLDATIEAVC
jgi:hypothetical protein